ncbi:MAG TPA: hypothetical protein VK669_07860 [Candidatus Limnocylindrales bacterium]|nr:hypothetical protein [Candidatus Limnocylindrales bacterium]
MSPRLYVETNFVMSVAKGQDADAELLLAFAESQRVELCLPEVCVMETFKVWERERRGTASLTRRLQKHIDDYKRRQTALGPSAAAILDNARVQADKQMNSVRGRAARCIQRIATHGRLIALSRRWAADGAEPRVIPSEPDDMILASVVEHARNEPEKHVGFATKNTKDFGDKAAVLGELASAGIKPFRSIGSALEWVTALSDAARPRESQ